MQLDFQTSLRHIRAEQTSVSVPNLYSLSRMCEEEMQLLRRAWPEVSAERRRRIIGLLVELAEADFAVDFNAVFRFCLTDEDDEVRKAAVDGLWEDKDAALIEPLAGLLRDDPSARVRAAAATALGRFVLLGELGKLEADLQASAEEALMEAIHSASEELEVRRRAVESIAYSGQEGVQDIIEDAYYHEREEMHVSAIFAMGRSADPYWSDIVIAELSSPDPAMRYEAAHACGELEISDAVPYLPPLTRDLDREVQEAAIWALGHIGGSEAQRILEECHAEGDESLREAIEEALEYLEFLRYSPEIPSLDDFEE